MDLKLSFVLPIYKVEAYLPQCVESIRSQLTDACEILLVDDGSPDRCGELCDQYAEADARIRVIHKKNGGLASARNAGLDQAGGDYLCFVDSDDWIEENTVPKLLNWIETEHRDVCFLNIRKMYPDGSVRDMGEEIHSSDLQGKNRAQVLTYLSSRPAYPGSGCGKLFRREFLMEHRLRYPGDRRLSEDLLFSVDVYTKAGDFGCLDFPFYCYRQERSDSITHNITPKYYFDTFLFVEEMARRYESCRETPEAVLGLSAAAYEYAVLVWQLCFLTGEDRMRALRLLKTHRWTLNYGQCRKTKLVRAAVTLCGISNAARLLDLYQNHRK